MAKDDQESEIEDLPDFDENKRMKKEDMPRMICPTNKHERKVMNYIADILYMLHALPPVIERALNAARENGEVDREFLVKVYKSSTKNMIEKMPILLKKFGTDFPRDSNQFRCIELYSNEVCTFAHLLKEHVVHD